MDTKKGMTRMLPIVWFASFYVADICLHSMATDIRVVTTAPVTPVVKGEILSVHCQVWSLRKGQDVSLFRTPENGGTERIAVIVGGEALIPGSSGTVFVAVRQMHDGSVVHFLSILDVTEHDAGEYSCEIDDVGGTGEALPKDSVYIDITYFPSEPDPVCSPGELSPVLAGNEVSLLCSSEEAYPLVDIQWTRSGSSEVLKSETDTRGGRAISVLKFTAGQNDSGKIFICQISSQGFPGRKETCHVGPFAVIPNKNAPETDSEHKDHLGITKTPFSLNLPTNSITDDQSSDKSARDRVRCWKTCSTESSSVMYWILATATASVLAFTFLILGIIMIVKYYRMPVQGNIPKAQYVPALQAGEEIYVEVESKRSDKSMYMSLEKPRKPEHRNFSTTGDM